MEGPLLLTTLIYDLVAENNRAFLTFHFVIAKLF